MDLCDPRVIRALLAKHGVSFSKALGQNFLIDPDVPTRIADAAGINSHTCVLEVGPGIGTLTERLCSRAREVIAVELDRRLEPVLSDTLGDFKNFRLIIGDILSVNLKEIVSCFPAGPVAACANLPYYITSKAIFALIGCHLFDRITLMVQLEVARRLCARPGGKDYGAITLYIQYHCLPSFEFEVGRESFIPSPKVDSAVITLVTRRQPPVEVLSENMFFKVIRAAFSQRRKTILNCLCSSFGVLTKAELEGILRSISVDPGRRGETMSLEEFAALANALMSVGDIEIYLTKGE